MVNTPINVDAIGVLILNGGTEPKKKEKLEHNSAVEYLPDTEKVVGSNPAVPTIIISIYFTSCEVLK